jgi:hypothetical protein
MAHIDDGLVDKRRQPAERKRRQLRRAPNHRL